MEKVLWIGSYIPVELLAQINEFGYYNPASVLSQSNIVDGIEKKLNFMIDKIGVLSFSGFPKEKLIFRRKCIDNHGIAVLAPVFNFKFINKISERTHLKREIKRYFKKREHCCYLDVFVYEMRSSSLRCLKLIKRFAPKSRIHLIVPDLPMYMDLKMGMFKKTLKRIDYNSMMKQLHYVDDYIVYAEPMVDYLNIRSKKWLLMEGSINLRDIRLINRLTHSENKESNAKRIIMYSGGLKKDFGINNLIKAIDILDTSYVLWLTGNGDMYKEIVSLAENNERIVFWGCLSTREEVLELQMKADVLVNMRNPEKPSSNYCFPSKLFEYMLLKKPIISPAIGGIPYEYYKFLFEIKDFSPDGIAETIKRVFAVDSKSMNGIMIEEREFILKNKNNYSQASKIINFVDSNYEE